MAAESGPPAAGSLVETARAKVNLYLHVTGRRADGYHELDSLVVFADFGDRLSFRRADRLTVEASGPFAGALPPAADNLVQRAAEGLAGLAAIEAKAAIHIEKRLPVASGIGGGSADAAAALRGLMRLWQVTPATDALEALALSLGADVPVCLAGRAAFVAGIGERLTPAPTLPACGLLLANPGVPVPTADVFRRRESPYSLATPFTEAPADAAALAALLRQRHNDLAAPACRLEPVISETLDALAALPGALLARMSGSGATCFALFADAGAAEHAATHLRRAHAGWWVAAGRIADAG